MIPNDYENHLNKQVLEPKCAVSVRKPSNPPGPGPTNEHARKELRETGTEYRTFSLFQGVFYISVIVNLLSLPLIFNRKSCNQIL